MMIQGKARWAKIVGKPVGGYPDGKGPEEWSIDIELDDVAKKQLSDAGMDPKYIKTAKDGSYEFVKFVRKAITFKGDPGKPFKIVDRAGNPWPQDKLIGNGSVMNVKCEVSEIVGSGAMKAKAFAFQVFEHVPYEGAEEFPIVADENWSED